MKINSTRIWLGFAGLVFVAVAIMVGVVFGQGIPVQIQGSSVQVQPAGSLSVGSSQQLQPAIDVQAQ